MGILHLTNGNCSPPIRAVRATQNRSQACALCAVLSPPHLGQGTFASQSPITCPKRQLPRTLGAIIFE